MFAKIYLVVVSVLYAGLALWCSFQPTVTSSKVGLELKGGSGESEFITVYGGLEMGMAIIFLVGVFRAEWLSASLFACVAMHVCLVLFRTITLFRCEDIGEFTYRLAIGEWIILVLGLIAMFVESRNN